MKEEKEDQRRGRHRGGGGGSERGSEEEEVEEKSSHQFPLACIVTAETQQDGVVRGESPTGRCALL